MVVKKFTSIIVQICPMVKMTMLNPVRQLALSTKQMLPNLVMFTKEQCSLCEDAKEALKLFMERVMYLILMLIK